ALGAMTHHDHNFFRLQFTCAVEHVGQHGFASDRMQYFGQVRLHTLAHACCQNHDIKHKNLPTRLVDQFFLVLLLVLRVAVFLAAVLVAALAAVLAAAFAAVFTDLAAAGALVLAEVWALAAAGLGGLAEPAALALVACWR